MKIRLTNGLLCNEIYHVEVASNLREVAVFYGNIRGAMKKRHLSPGLVLEDKCVKIFSP